MLPRSYTFDTLLEMKDAGLIAADAAATVGGSAKRYDCGPNTEFSGVLVVNVRALEIASNDEVYNILVQGSNSATFASGIINLAGLEIGAQEALPGGADTDYTTGRYEVPFFNRQGEVLYRYLRVYTDVAGTIATGINYDAFIGRANLFMPS